jgi:hypothetical protein
MKASTAARRNAPLVATARAERPGRRAGTARARFPAQRLPNWRRGEKALSDLRKGSASPGRFHARTSSSGGDWRPAAERDRLVLACAVTLRAGRSSADQPLRNGGIRQSTPAVMDERFQQAIEQAAARHAPGLAMRMPSGPATMACSARDAGRDAVCAEHQWDQPSLGREHLR